MANHSEPHLPQNITIQVGSGGGDKSFFDRHFAAILAAIGVIGAAVITTIYKQNESITDPVPNFEIVTSDPVVDKPVVFLVSETMGHKYKMLVAAIDGVQSAKGTLAKRTEDGIFYVWTPTTAGDYVAELTVLVKDNKGYEMTRKFKVQPISTQASPPKVEDAKAPLISQTFSHRIGDSSSCTEREVTRKFDVCLPPDTVLVDWEGRYQSERNGTADVVRSPSHPNCAVLTLRYSDSGLGLLGDCKGNGWVDYAVTLNGRKQPVRP